MAAFSLGHFLRTDDRSSSTFHIKKPSTRTKFSVSCRSQGGRKGEKQQGNNKQRLWTLLLELKESLSPKQKGDWKDLVLMSLSFAVYVYISQRIVSAYCAWMSILKQSM